MKNLIVFFALITLSIASIANIKINTTLPNYKCWDFAKPCIIIDSIELINNDLSKIKAEIYQNKTIIQNAELKINTTRQGINSLIIKFKKTLKAGEYTCIISDSISKYEIPVIIYKINDDYKQYVDTIIKHNAFYGNHISFDLNDRFNKFDSEKNYYAEIRDENENPIIRTVGLNVFDVLKKYKNSFKSIKVIIYWKQPETEESFEFYNSTTIIKVPKPEITDNFSTTKTSKNANNYNIKIGPLKLFLPNYDDNQPLDININETIDYVRQTETLFLNRIIEYININHNIDNIKVLFEEFKNNGFEVPDNLDSVANYIYKEYYCKKGIAGYNQIVKLEEYKNLNLELYTITNIKISKPENGLFFLDLSIKPKSTEQKEKLNIVIDIKISAILKNTENSALSEKFIWAYPLNLIIDNNESNNNK